MQKYCSVQHVSKCLAEVTLCVGGVGVAAPVKNLNERKYEQMTH